MDRYRPPGPHRTIPRAPGSAATDENTNGLPRQGFPEGTDLAAHGAEDLAALAAALDGRPRKLLARGVPILVADADAPFDTYEEMVAHVQANPGEVKVGSTGPGGLPSVVAAMLQSQDELPMTAVPYDGDGPALTALMGGAVDVYPAVLGAAIEGIEAGRMKPIAILETEANPLVPDVPPITEARPEIAQFLPWGPFFGVFVAQGTPEEAVTKLRDAYAEAARSEGFGRLMEDRGYERMNITGEEATAFLDRWQSVTSWLLHDTGATKASPEEFGIARP